MRVFFSNPWIPIEWIKAHGHEPRGIWSSEPGTMLVLPEGICAFAGGMMTAATSCHEAAFVFTTACDQMRRAADAVIDAGHPHTFLFNLPSTWQTETARTLYHEESARFSRFLGRLGGSPPSNDRLREVIRHCDQERSELLLRASQGIARDVVQGLVDYYAPGAAHRARWQSGAAEHELQMLGETGQPVDLPGSFRSTRGLPRLSSSEVCRPETRSAGTNPAKTFRSIAGHSSTGQPRVRLALVGGPLWAPQSSLFDTIESCGGQIVLNATEPGERTLPPPLGADLSGADPRTALADHYFDHIVDVFQRPNSKLYSWLGRRLSARHVRGILLWVHVGCDLWRAEAESLREAFSLPLLMLESHDLRGVPPREAHRLQAFIESLR